MFMFSNSVSRRIKIDALRQDNALNFAPDKVKDQNFKHSEFFDPCDAVQVRYELLRSVKIDKKPVTLAVSSYGFSRSIYYQLKTRFEQSGITGLISKKRCLHGSYKLNENVMLFIWKNLRDEAPIQAQKLAKQIQCELNLKIHPRTIERAVKKENLQNIDNEQKNSLLNTELVCIRYEALRTMWLNSTLPLEGQDNSAFFLQYGMLRWAKATKLAIPTATQYRSETPELSSYPKKEIIQIIANMLIDAINYEAA
jgi:transposase